MRVLLHGERDRILDLLRQLRRDPFQAAAVPDAHAVRVQVLRLAADDLAQDAHQPRHFVRRAPPVLGGEGVDGEHLDAEVGAGASDTRRMLSVPAL